MIMKKIFLSATNSRKLKRIKIACIPIMLTVALLLNATPVDAALSRTDAVSEMKSQATVGWSAQKTITIYYTTTTSTQTYNSGITYKGLPYSQCRPGNSYNTFVTLCGGFEDGYNSLFINGASYNDATHVCIGNDCSSAVLRAWEAGGKTFTVNKTNSITGTQKWGNTATLLTSAVGSIDGVKIVGVGSLTVASGNSASTICTNNGSTKMTTAYKLLKSGDACLKSGHIILVTAVSSTGITYTDQYKYNINGYSSWHNGAQMKWADLYTGRFIPITVF